MGSLGRRWCGKASCSCSVHLDASFPAASGVKCNCFFPFPLSSHQIKARKRLHQQDLLLDLQSVAISNNHQAVSFPPTSPYLPPPPSLTKGKKELEPQLEIYHAIVYHEFLVNHIGEAGLFISETLNQYKVGLLVLKLGWSVKK